MINSGWWAAWDTLPLRVFLSLIVDELIGNRSLTSGGKVELSEEKGVTGGLFSSVQIV